MLKHCNTCNTDHIVDEDFLEETEATDLGYWFDCDCGSTLIIPINTLLTTDYIID